MSSGFKKQDVVKGVRHDMRSAGGGALHQHMPHETLTGVGRTLFLGLVARS